MKGEDTNSGSSGTEGIRFGCLWGILIPSVYTLLFIIFVVVTLHEPFPQQVRWFEFLGWVFRFGFFSLLYLMIYIVLLIPSIIIGLYIGFKDPSISKTMKVIWPFLLGLIYAIAPDFFPGPVDDLIVNLLLGGLGVYNIRESMARKKKKVIVRQRESIDEEKMEILDSGGKSVDSN